MVLSHRPWIEFESSDPEVSKIGMNRPKKCGD